MPTEIERLEQVIAVIESQRPALGTIADDALAPLQTRHAELQAAMNIHKTSKRETTFLYCETQNLSALRDAVSDAGGNILNPDPTLFIGMFSGDDAAPRAATAALFAQKADLFKIGIASGVIQTGELRLDDPVIAAASQLYETAAPGMTLAEQNAYRHLRGLFNIEGAGERELTPDAAPTPIYVITEAKEQPFRTVTRSIEGVETRMIGRNTEFEQMQQTFNEAVQGGYATAITLFGPGGIGKSRLRYEFENYVELLPDRFYGFQARGMEHHRHTPFSVLRNLLFNRFNIHLNDSPQAARHKLTSGLAEFLERDADEYAAIIGHVIGLDCTDSVYLSGIISQQTTSTQQITGRARHYIVQILQQIAKLTDYPIVIYLEDLHWADDASLNLLEHIANNCQDIPLVMLCMARPVLLDRRPHWLDILPNRLDIHLSPLTREAMRDLVDEIMQKVERLPDILREMLAGGADGNPYYLETLVSLLIDKDVIVKDVDSWRVAPDKLITASMPLALEDVINARLDGVNPESLTGLYQAATVGRAFWSSALGRIRGEDEEATQALIASWHERDLVYALSESTLAGMQEVFFKHNLLHETVYRAIPPASRIQYHQQAVQWLIDTIIIRKNEWLTILAMHYVYGEEYQRATEHALEAANFAIERDAYQQAIDICNFLINYLPPQGYPRARAYLQEAIGRAYRLGQFEDNHTEAIKAYQRGLSLLKSANDPETQVKILNGLALSYRALNQLEAAQADFNQAVDIAQQLNDRSLLATVSHTGGVIAMAAGNFAEASENYRTSLSHYEKLGEPSGIIQTILNLGYSMLLTDHPEQALPYYNRALKLAEEVRDYWGISVALLNMGEIARVRGEYDNARDYFERSLSMSERVGNESNIAINILNLGMLALSNQNYPEARPYLLDALHMTTRLNRVADQLYTLVAIARLWAETNDPNSAMTLLGLVTNHPKVDHETRHEAETVIKMLEEHVGARMVQIGIQSGRSLNLDTIIRQILTKHHQP